eukprot:CAMPEP_0172778476 /NCGR_PEP_ID=MMETSP1074-20121228/201928_1 /TAXON_ID=2916 /ORGANISM="Ceratium fusus, Strain PA161109" /LENGTH=132 /DNA_ID=CAMNT_0013615411 /DNA_START=185 /DNA_END=583 /DNA_ORIENTATION=-
MLPVLAQVVTDAPPPRLLSVRMTADICVTSVSPGGDLSATVSPEMLTAAADLLSPAAATAPLSIAMIDATVSPEMLTAAADLLSPAAATAPLSIAMIEVANFKSQFVAILRGPVLPSLSVAAVWWPAGTCCV